MTEPGKGGDTPGDQESAGIQPEISDRDSALPIKWPIRIALSPSRTPIRIPAMSVSDTTDSRSCEAFERAARRSNTLRRWAAATVVAGTALVGVDFTRSAFGGFSSSDRLIVVTRALGQSNAGGLDSATGLGWTAAVLALILISRRSLGRLTLHKVRLIVANSARQARPWLMLRRRIAISHRAGGLYGP